MSSGIQPKGQSFQDSFALDINLSELCNLKCTYCFEEVLGNKPINDKTHLRVPTDHLLTGIDEFLKNSRILENDGEVRIGFWGGEPTLNIRALTAILEHYAENVRISFHLYTNGYDIKPFHILKATIDKYPDVNWKKKLSIQVSYDGKVVNDKTRPDCDGNCTSERVVENFGKITDLGFNVVFKSTLPDDMIYHIEEVWDEFRELVDRFPNGRVNFAPTMDSSTGDVKINMKTLSGILANITRKEYEFDKEHGRNLMSWFTGQGGSHLCTAGKNMAAIDVDGSVFICHGCMYGENKEQLRYGNMCEEPLNDILNRLYGDFEPLIVWDNRPDKCSSCLSTYCSQCPAAKYTRSKCADFKDQWIDVTCDTGICGIYKLIGTYKRALEKQRRIDNGPVSIK